eukprot:7289524-Heterocapsa_arctica.AAC.1
MARYDTGLASATSKYQSDLKTIMAKADAAAISSASKDREILEMRTQLAAMRAMMQKSFAKGSGA